MSGSAHFVDLGRTSPDVREVPIGDMRGISSHQPGWHITSELLRRSLHQPALVFGKPDRHPQPPPAMCNRPGIGVNELEHSLSTKQSATNDFKNNEVARTLTDRRLLQQNLPIADI